MRLESVWLSVVFKSIPIFDFRRKWLPRTVTAYGAELILRIGFTGLCLFAFGAWLSTALAYLGLLLMACAAFVHQPGGLLATLPRSVQQLTISLIVYVFAVCAYATWREPSLAGNHISGTWDWIILFAVIIVAYWFSLYRHKWVFFMCLVVAGLSLDMAREVIRDYPQFIAGFRGVRFDFGKPMIASGLYAGMALIFLFAVFSKIREEANWVLKCLKYVTWYFMASFMFLCVIFTQSRMVWAGMFAVIVSFIGILCYRAIRNTHTCYKLKTKVGVSLLIVGVVAAWVSMPVVSNRLAYERADIASIWAGDTEDLRYGSAGVRWRLVEYGWDLFNDRPLLGYGPGSSKPLISQSPDANLRNMPHLHNAYLEVLLRLGIIGSAIFLALLCAITYHLYRCHKTGSAPPEIAWFVYANLLFVAIYNFGSYRLDHMDMRVYWYIVIASALAAVIRQPQREQSTGNLPDGLGR